MKDWTNVASRVLLAQLFIIAGVGKIAGYAGTQAYMASMGVPGQLLPLVILLEVGGGIAIVAGWQTRWVSLLLAGFTLVSAAIFHHNLADQTQMIMFMKNLSITGGFLLLAAYGPGRYSLDGWRDGK